MDVLNYEVVGTFRELFKTLGINGYLVGGAVRDIILGKDPLDFDFTAELNEEQHLKKSEEIGRLLGCSFKYNSHYHTAKFQYNGNDIDFVMARDEYYPDIASKPIVHSSGIIKDILRRDFTVNSLALNLGEKFGEILDPAGGIKDLEKKSIRVLHDKSFRDDPTRLFRGIKYASRFNFNIEDRTFMLMREGLDKGYLSCLSTQRVAQEVFRVLEDCNSSNSISTFRNLMLFNYISGEKININLCYNERVFDLLPNRKKLSIMFYQNKLEDIIKLKDAMGLGEEFIDEIFKIKLVESKFLDNDKSFFRLLFSKQNSLDFETLSVVFPGDSRIKNFIRFKDKVKIPIEEIRKLDCKRREDFILDWKVEKIINLSGGN